ncbi:MAG: hypothetical protein QOI41_2218 [Myxococcales bacterium]|nr:hypothetical protein [Myxococcales bacterium]
MESSPHAAKQANASAEIAALVAIERMASGRRPEEAVMRMPDVNDNASSSGLASGFVAARAVRGAELYFFASGARRLIDVPVTTQASVPTRPTIDTEVEGALVRLSFVKAVPSQR